MARVWKSFVWCVVLTLLIVPLADAAKKKAEPAEEEACMLGVWSGGVFFKLGKAM